MAVGLQHDTSAGAASASVRLLIDECLSPALAREAQNAGIEAYHVAHLGMARLRDAAIVEFAIARDMTLVTNNASDFRRLYARQALHPGLVIIVPNVEQQMQLLLFQAVLKELQARAELINRALEAHLERDGVRLDAYELPRPSG